MAGARPSRSRSGYIGTNLSMLLVAEWRDRAHAEIGPLPSNLALPSRLLVGSPKRGSPISQRIERLIEPVPKTGLDSAGNARTEPCRGDHPGHILASPARAGSPGDRGGRLPRRCLPDRTVADRLRRWQRQIIIICVRAPNLAVSNGWGDDRCAGNEQGRGKPDKETIKTHAVHPIWAARRRSRPTRRCFPAPVEAPRSSAGR